MGEYGAQILQDVEMSEPYRMIIYTEFNVATWLRMVK